MNHLQLQSELRRHGAAISQGWCAQFLASSNDSSFESAIGALLSSDLHACNDNIGCLSAITSSDQELQGCRFILQCDEIVNVAAPAKERFPAEGGGGGGGGHNSHRMLKLKLTDGVKTILAFEYRSIPCLSHSLPAGIKIVIKGDLFVRSGMIMLQPHNIEVLGGQVQRLEEARRRAVEAWNRPVGGREGQGEGRNPFREARAAAALSTTPPLLAPIPNPRPPTPVPVDIDEATPATDQTDVSFLQPRPAATSAQNQGQQEVIEIDDDDGEDAMTLQGLREKLKLGQGFEGRVAVENVIFKSAEFSEEGLFVQLKRIGGGKSINCFASDEMQRKFLGNTIAESSKIQDRERLLAQKEQEARRFGEFRGAVVLEWDKDRKMPSVIQAKDIDG